MQVESPSTESSRSAQSGVYVHSHCTSRSPACAEQRFFMKVMLSCGSNVTLRMEQSNSNPTGQKNRASPTRNADFCLHLKSCRNLMKAGIRNMRSRLRESIVFFRNCALAYTKPLLLRAPLVKQVVLVPLPNHTEAICVRVAAIRNMRSRLHESTTFFRKCVLAYAKPSLLKAPWLTQAPARVRLHCTSGSPAYAKQHFFIKVMLSCG